MQVSLQALKAFEAAARLGSFKAAAKELSLSPTAISHHISNLESRLDMLLFHRQVRSITLTKAGKQLSIATTQGFSTIEQALNEVETSSHTLNVTTTSSFAAMVLIQALREFQQLHPDIVIEVATGESLDKHLANIPIRMGNSAEVSEADILKQESFDIFGAAQAFPRLSETKPMPLFTTEWKNTQLPSPPLQAWLTRNNLSLSCFQLKTYDQELYGIHEALAGNGLVFCSTTLTDRLVSLNLLHTYATQPVCSELCYYIPNKDSFLQKNQTLFIHWLASILNAPP